MHELLVIILTAAAPFIELRGAIPLGILGYRLDPLLVFSISVIINILIIPILLLGLDFFGEYALRISLVKRLVDRSRKKAARHINDYGVFGLSMFVAIPLPGSGAYSGALIAYVLGMRRSLALLAIAIGVLAAGILVTLASMGVISLALLLS